MKQLPNYSRFEIERRWLVDPAQLPEIQPALGRKIEDMYLPNTGLRLRKVTLACGRCEYKLTKKYGKVNPITEPIANLYLTEIEYQTLKMLEGPCIRKTRYSVWGGALDIYQEPKGAPSIFEIEFDNPDEANQYAAPDFVECEVTSNPNYSGWYIANRRDS